ncbi:hypothetical protein VULLAG_LOCUS22860 [Vulpes lagopus]
MHPGRASGVRRPRQWCTRNIAPSPCAYEAPPAPKPGLLGATGAPGGGGGATLPGKDRGLLPLRQRCASGPGGLGALGAPEVTRGPRCCRGTRGAETEAEPKRGEGRSGLAGRSLPHKPSPPRSTARELSRRAIGEACCGSCLPGRPPASGAQGLPPAQGAPPGDGPFRGSLGRRPGDEGLASQGSRAKLDKALPSGHPGSGRQVGPGGADGIPAGRFSSPGEVGREQPSAPFQNFPEKKRRSALLPKRQGPPSTWGKGHAVPPRTGGKAEALGALTQAPG